MSQSQGARVVAGKQMLFTRVAMILMDLRQNPKRQVDADEAEILDDAAEALHEADGWRRFSAPGTSVGDDAKETYNLLARVAGPMKSGDVWTEFWGTVHGVEATLKSLADGGTASIVQLEAASELCLKVSSQGPGPTRPSRVQ